MVREAVVLTDEATKERFEFPVNPESIGVTMGRNFREVPVVNLDSVLLAGNFSPVGLSWSGFFPAVFDQSYCNYPPENPTVSVRRIEKWMGRKGTAQSKPVPLRSVVTGTYFSRLMVVTDFETEFRGGEPRDIYYTISLQSWRVQQIRVNSPTPPSGGGGSRPKTTPAPRTYKVKKGDTLWAIAKRFYGNGAKWPTIYNANRKIIGSNPNLIRPNQVFVIP